MATVAPSTVDVDRTGVTANAELAAEIRRWGEEHADRINRLILAVETLRDEVEAIRDDLETRVTALEP